MLANDNIKKKCVGNPATKSYHFNNDSLLAMNLKISKDISISPRYISRKDLIGYCIQIVE